VTVKKFQASPEAELKQGRDFDFEYALKSESGIAVDDEIPDLAIKFMDKAQKDGKDQHGPGCCPRLRNGSRSVL
jgi:hypothetical protein